MTSDQILEKVEMAIDKITAMRSKGQDVATSSMQAQVCQLKFLAEIAYQLARMNEGNGISE